MKKIVSLTLEIEIIEKLKELAEKEGRNFSNMVEYIVRKYMDDVE